MNHLLWAPMSMVDLNKLYMCDTQRVIFVGPCCKYITTDCCRQIFTIEWIRDTYEKQTIYNNPLWFAIEISCISPKKTHILK